MHITTTLIGMMSLNTSFILYLFIYVPQLLHNRRAHHIETLSLGMHILLCLSYCLDLLYGFAKDLQWQYKTVSVVALMLLTIQHLQLTRTYHAHKQKGRFYFNLLFILTTATAIAYLFIDNTRNLSAQTIQILGYTSRAGFLMYTIPQLIKNRALQSAQAISAPFIYLSLILSMLDMISAWCLHWGWPNQLGAPITMLLLLMLLLQRKQYSTSVIVSQPLFA